MHSSGVYTTKCGKGQQNHEMVAVGYGTTSGGIDYWV